MRRCSTRAPSRGGADLDHNGKLETIGIRMSGHPQATLHVFIRHGSERTSGWRLILESDPNRSVFFLIADTVDLSGNRDMAAGEDRA